VLLVRDPNAVKNFTQIGVNKFAKYHRDWSSGIDLYSDAEGTRNLENHIEMMKVLINLLKLSHNNTYDPRL